MENFVLRVMGKEDNAACGTEHLAGGLEAGIEGGIRTMCLLWSQNSEDEDWGFLLVDTRNAFYEENQMVILWEVQHV